MGMGPRSTAPLVDMVVDECGRQYGAVYDNDFPAMVIYSLPTPFYPDRLVDHDAMRGAIMSGLKELAGFGVDFIAMPCNIAHVYYDELKASVSLPLLNIIDETVARLPRRCRSVALLAARGTAESGLYQKGIAAGGLSVYMPGQDRIDKLILSVKKNGLSRENTDTMFELLSGAKSEGADCAVIGCTDLTPLALGCNAGIRILDSARCLAAAAVKRYIELKDLITTG